MTGRRASLRRGGLALSRIRLVDQRLTRFAIRWRHCFERVHGMGDKISNCGKQTNSGLPWRLLRASAIAASSRTGARAVVLLYGDESAALTHP